MQMRTPEHVLILTYWNVKQTPRKKFVKPTVVLILTYWNVKVDNIISYGDVIEY